MARGDLVPGCDEEHREWRGWKPICFGQRKGMVISALCRVCNAGSLRLPAPSGEHDRETWRKYFSLPAPGNTNLVPGWHRCLLNHVQSNLPLVSRPFFSGVGFWGCFFAHLPPRGCPGAGSWEQPGQCSLFVLQRLNIDVEMLPVPQDGLRSNLVETHQVCKGQDRCYPSKIPLVLQRVFPPAFPAQGRIRAG